MNIMIQQAVIKETYLTFTMIQSEVELENAKKAYVNRFGEQPAQIVQDQGLVKLGPVPKEAE